MTPGTNIVEDELCDDQSLAAAADNANTMNGTTVVTTQLYEVPVVDIDENSDREKEQELNTGAEDLGTTPKFLYRRQNSGRNR